MRKQVIAIIIVSMFLSPGVIAGPQMFAAYMMNNQAQGGDFQRIFGALGLAGALQQENPNIFTIMQLMTTTLGASNQLTQTMSSLQILTQEDPEGYNPLLFQGYNYAGNFRPTQKKSDDTGGDEGNVVFIDTITGRQILEQLDNEDAYYQEIVRKGLEQGACTITLTTDINQRQDEEGSYSASKPIINEAYGCYIGNPEEIEDYSQRLKDFNQILPVKNFEFSMLRYVLFDIRNQEDEGKNIIIRSTPSKREEDPAVVYKNLEAQPAKEEGFTKLPPYTSIIFEFDKEGNYQQARITPPKNQDQLTMLLHDGRTVDVVIKKPPFGNFANILFGSNFILGDLEFRDAMITYYSNEELLVHEGLIIKDIYRISSEEEFGINHNYDNAVFIKDDGTILTKGNTKITSDAEELLEQGFGDVNRICRVTEQGMQEVTATAIITAGKQVNCLGLGIDVEELLINTDNPNQLLIFMDHNKKKYCLDKDTMCNVENLRRFTSKPLTTAVSIEIQRFSNSCHAIPRVGSCVITQGTTTFFLDDIGEQGFNDQLAPLLREARTSWGLQADIVPIEEGYREQEPRQGTYCIQCYGQGVSIRSVRRDQGARSNPGYFGCRGIANSDTRLVTECTNHPRCSTYENSICYIDYSYTPRVEHPRTDEEYAARSCTRIGELLEGYPIIRGGGKEFCYQGQAY